MRFDFDSYIERRKTSSMKWDTYPDDILPMWVADTDFRSPPLVTEAIVKQASRGIFGYPLNTSDFLDACIHWQKERFNWNLNPDQVIWCPSLGVAIALCIRAFTRPKDGVAILTPIYPPFINLCKMNDREPRASELKWEDGEYRIDFHELEAILARPDTSLFLLCNPHNPTGRVFTREELMKMGELCRRYKVIVFSDEIHEDIIYSGAHIPFPSLSAELAALSLSGVNPSKTFNVADLRCAAIISEERSLLEKVKNEIQALKLGPSSLGLAGATRAWNSCADYADELLAYLKNNAEHAVDFINRDCQPIHAYMPEATFLLWLDCRDLGLGNDELKEFFINEAKVGLNPGVDFGPGGEGFMRLNFGCPRFLLDEGLDRIRKALKRRNM